MQAGVRSAISVPLLGRSGPIGALYADRTALRGTFEAQQIDYAAAFAAHAASALETAQLYDDREQHFRLTLEALAKAIDARDKYTAGHSERVTNYTLVLAKAMKLPEADLDVLRRAGMLHDIGKVGVPDHVLLKPAALDAAERAIIESHVTIGYEMLKDLPFLRDALPAIRGHHERWDGRGYPDRLAGERIHLYARIMTVADSFDAMTSARPYRHALPFDEASRRLHADAGTQFDAAVVKAFDVSAAELCSMIKV
jgi:putative nucleotidyltransferase with HDIG domain